MLDAAQPTPDAPPQGMAHRCYCILRLTHDRLSVCTERVTDVTSPLCTGCVDSGHAQHPHQIGLPR